MDPLHRKAKEPYNPLRSSRPPQRRPPVPSQSRAPPPKVKQQPVEEEPEPDYEDSTEWTCYTLTTTKSSILAGNRHHVMRLHPKFVEVPDPADKTGKNVIMVPETVNITDPETFKQPIRLHRRDATAPLAGKNQAEASKLETPKPVDEEERKMLEFKAEKARRREELMSKVAPDGGGRNNFKIKGEKKTQQVRQSNADQVANRKMRYEEEYPWFLEDADNGQTWQGQREHAMSNGEFVVLQMDHVQGSFSMIPVEKWYRFTKVKRVNKMTEKEIKAGEKVLSGEEPALPSWAKKVPKEFVDTEELTKQEQRLYAKNAALVPKRQIKTVKGREESNQGNEELDFNVEDQFDNDDAGGLLGDFGEGNEGEEAAKDAAKRIIKDQLSANVFGSRTEKDIIEERRKLKTRQKLLKAHGKKVSKALKRREGNYIYDSDEEDPYLNKLLSASDNDSDSDSEAEAEEFKKWKLELKKAAAEKEAEEARKVEAKKETAKRATEKRKAKKQAEKRESPADDIPTSAPATPALIPHAVSKSVRNEVKSRKRSRSPESQKSTKRRCNDLAPNPSINSPLISPAPQPRANVKKRPRSPEPAKPQKPSGLLKRRRQNKVVPDNTISVPEQKNTNSASPTVLKSPSPSTNTAPDLPITDEEIIAVLRADPEGVSSKDITEAFRSRIKAGTKDVSALAQRLKQFGSREGDIKKWKLKKEFA
ncbi:uncharacterized protein H6S33_005170 [Morchella sextelata]|uniref:uncharacterized protein n=1 Tax=Morchella sextelata TaxID=1174677 RepID=UPI001D049C24|nr:uncharacterized protein H6S33_005170 [Morchella sextelata]KAH0605188.1 hypothetical protein H6S33_005170 [Morchella sextelata]